MADTVTTKVVFESQNRLVVHITNVSDGTGESAVVKVNKSDFTGPNGSEPSHLALEKVMYDVGSIRVLLQWDHTTDETIAVLQTDGILDWYQDGKGPYLLDTETGGAGDILLTTANQTVGDGYDITLFIRKKD